MSDRLNSDAFVMLDKNKLREALNELQELEWNLSPVDVASDASLKLRAAIWTLMGLIEEGGDWLKWGDETPKPMWSELHSEE
jgi:hypothetical protein